jgi:hypothetical protein
MDPARSVRSRMAVSGGSVVANGAACIASKASGMGGRVRHGGNGNTISALSVSVHMPTVRGAVGTTEIVFADLAGALCTGTISSNLEVASALDCVPHGVSGIWQGLTTS